MLFLPYFLCYTNTELFRINAVGRTFASGSLKYWRVGYAAYCYTLYKPGCNASGDAAAGALAAKRVKSADDYNVGGRSSGAGLVAGTIIGTIVGGAATVGTAQLGFKLGLTAWWFTLGSGIALLLMAAFYAVPLRRSSLTTVAEYLVTDYGKPAGWLATFSACAGIFSAS